MDPSWKFYSKLNQKKYRQKHNLFFIEGVRLCKEALLSGKEIEYVFLCESFLEKPEFKNFHSYFDQHHLPVKIINVSNFKRLADTRNPQGILFVLKIPQNQSFKEERLKKEKFILFLEDISDPGNIGTIIRTADWFGIELIYVSQKSVDFYSPKVVRASMGSILRVDIVKTKDLSDIIQILKNMGFTIISTDVTKGVPLVKAHVQPPLGLILGAETQGVSSKLHELATIKVRIPQYGKAESLNVAIAAGILMNFFRQ